MCYLHDLAHIRKWVWAHSTMFCGVSCCHCCVIQYRLWPCSSQPNPSCNNNWSCALFIISRQKRHTFGIRLCDNFPPTKNFGKNECCTKSLGKAVWCYALLNPCVSLPDAKVASDDQIWLCIISNKCTSVFRDGIHEQDNHEPTLLNMHS